MVAAPRPALHGLALAALGALFATAGAPGPERPRPAADRVHVVATTSLLAQLARAVGGDDVTVLSLSDPRQNPHFVDPRPTLMQRARKADVFVEVGLQLEPWARRVIGGSGNPRIQIGQPGHVVAARGIATLEVPERLSRTEGNIHPFGNPYVWLDPLNVKRMAANIADGLARVDVERAAGYRERLASFEARIDEALFGAELVREVGGAKLDRLARQGRLREFLRQRDMESRLGGWLGRAANLDGRPVVSHHKTWVYFAARFGFEVVIEIEEKPGILPSTRHRERVLQTIRERGVRTLLIENYQDRRLADDLAKRSGARVVAVPIGVGPEVGLEDYEALIGHLIERLVDSERER